MRIWYLIFALQSRLPHKVVKVNMIKFANCFSTKEPSFEFHDLIRQISCQRLISDFSSPPTNTCAHFREWECLELILRWKKFHSSAIVTSLEIKSLPKAFWMIYAITSQIYSLVKAILIMQISNFRLSTATDNKMQIHFRFFFFSFFSATTHAHTPKPSSLNQINNLKQF